MHFSRSASVLFGSKPCLLPPVTPRAPARTLTLHCFCHSLHSHWEAPGYFDAADEHGFFVSPGLPSNCNTPACTNLTLRTWKKLIETHRNNPSVMDACMGNEGYAAWMPVNGHRELFYNTSKALRSDLFVIDTDGCCWVHGSEASQYSHFEDVVDSYSVCGNNLPASDSAGQCDRDTNDFMTAFFGGPMGGTPFIYPLMYDMQAGGACNLTHSNPGSCTPPKPIISHEMGNFGSFPNLTSQIIAMNTSKSLKTTNPMQTLKSMVDQNLDGELSDWVITSCEHA